MTVETWPATLIPNQMTWGIVTNSLGLESPWTGSGQFHELQGARWTCQVVFRSLDDAQARELAGFLDHLRGPVGVVAVPAWIHDEPRGNAGGTILGTAAAHAKWLALSGITGANPAFRRGDLIGVAGRLYRISAGGSHDAGNLTVGIAPPLRAAAAAAAVSLTGLTCPMRLMGDDNALGRFRPRPFGDFQVSFVEALP